MTCSAWLVLHLRMLLPEGGHGRGEGLQGHQTTAADGDHPAHVSMPFQLLLHLFHQGGDLFGTPAQHDAGVGEGQVTAPHKELHPQFLLQLGHLAAEGGLGHMEDLCGS